MSDFTNDDPPPPHPSRVFRFQVAFYRWGDAIPLGFGVKIGFGPGVTLWTAKGFGGWRRVFPRS